MTDADWADAGAKSVAMVLSGSAQPESATMAPRSSTTTWRC